MMSGNKVQWHSGNLDASTETSVYLPPKWLVSCQESQHPFRCVWTAEKASQGYVLCPTLYSPMKFEDIECWVNAQVPPIVRWPAAPYARGEGESSLTPKCSRENCSFLPQQQDKDSEPSKGSRESCPSLSSLRDVCFSDLMCVPNTLWAVTWRELGWKSH